MRVPVPVTRLIRVGSPVPGGYFQSGMPCNGSEDLGAECQPSQEDDVSNRI